MDTGIIIILTGRWPMFIFVVSMMDTDNYTIVFIWFVVDALLQCLHFMKAYLLMRFDKIYR